MTLDEAINEAVSQEASEAVSIPYPKDKQQKTNQQFIRDTIENDTRLIINNTIYEIIVKKINFGLNRTISTNLNRIVSSCYQPPEKFLAPLSVPAIITR